MQKMFHASCIVMIILLSGSLYGMQTDTIQPVYRQFSDEVVAHIAGYSGPCEKNVLLKVCKDFYACLKNRELIIKTNPFTVSSVDRIWAMFRYARLGDHTMIHSLLNTGINPDYQGHFGLTPLFVAAQSGRSEVVRLLINAQADPELASHAGCTPLHVASHYGYFKVVELLLAARANIYAKNNFGKTPLQIAHKSGYIEIENLIQARAKYFFEINKIRSVKRKTC